MATGEYQKLVRWSPLSVGRFQFTPNDINDQSLSGRRMHVPDIDIPTELELTAVPGHPGAPSSRTGAGTLGWNHSNGVDYIVMEYLERVSAINPEAKRWCVDEVVSTQHTKNYPLLLGPFGRG